MVAMSSPASKGAVKYFGASLVELMASPMVCGQQTKCKKKVGEGTRKREGKKMANEELPGVERTRRKNEE